MNPSLPLVTFCTGKDMVAIWLFDVSGRLQGDLHVTGFYADHAGLPVDHTVPFHPDPHYPSLHASDCQKLHTEASLV